MVKYKEGSTERLLQLCLGYFIFYVLTGLSVKFFLSSGPGRPGMSNIEYLVYSTASSTLFATSVAIFLKWYRFNSIKLVSIWGMKIPYEIFYIIPSGICTAVIIPTTTLMYSFKNISVMVAMVLMRGAVIVIGRIVDAIQIKQGILRKKVYWEENVAVVFALLAIFSKVLIGGNGGKQNPFTSLPVVIIFSSYILSYAIRIYIMNFYKNTRPKGIKVNTSKGFFAVEQFTSTVTIYLVTIILLILYKKGAFSGYIIAELGNAVFSPVKGWWYWAMIAGLAFGIVAFFSVFIFMYKGRTATFAGLVNRLTSLLAGTTSTLLFAVFFGGKYPSLVDWFSFVMIIIAIYFMSKSEQKRTKELEREL